MHDGCLHRGFTLIELSIVLVIIGLIVGGILVGQDLISAAYVRAQVSQIEKYNTAVNTFYGKYGSLPGDMGTTHCTQFGFVGCSSRGVGGQGDENGVIQGVFPDPSYLSGSAQGGEPIMVWVDLSTAGLIDGAFNNATPAGANFGSAPIPTAIATAWPTAKIGGGNYVLAWSYSSVNYFLIFNITSPSLVAYGGCCSFGGPTPFAGPSVRQAYAIDAKIDDGMPMTGRVTAFYPVNQWVMWSGGYTDNPGGYVGYNNAIQGYAEAGSSTTCFDNGGNTSNTEQYSITQNNGNGANCPLSFKFQ